MKRTNVDLGQESNAINSDIMDAKANLNQKDIEVQRIRQEISRSEDEGRFLRNNIEEQKRQLTNNY